MLPSDLCAGAASGVYGPAQRERWEHTLAALRATLQADVFAALQARNSGETLRALLRQLRTNGQLLDELGRANQAAAAAEAAASRPGTLLPTPSASGRARDAALATLLHMERTFNAELEAVEEDMRSAFVHGFREDARLPGWRAALAREATQLAAAMATVDGVSSAGCLEGADRNEVAERRSVVAANIQARIDTVQQLQRMCAELWTAFETLRLRK